MFTELQNDNDNKSDKKWNTAEKNFRTFFGNYLFDNKKSSYLMSVSILITCLQDNVWILEGNVTR